MVRTHAFHAMGCEILVALESDTDQAALEQVPAWFEDWEQCLSRFRRDSELSIVNLQAGRPTVVSPVFAEVFELALEAEYLSAGLITPVLLDALVQAGYDRNFDSLAAQKTANEMVSLDLLPNLNEVEWDADRHTLLLPSDMHLDFGGLAKGWAAQQSVHRLSEIGPALVDAGGDIAISGLQSGGCPWPVGVSNPFEPSENLEILHLGKGGVATSGRDKRRWVHNGRWQHHIIDPRTGMPALTDVLAVTVVADSVMEAERVAKTILILGSEQGLAWLKANPGLAGIVILESGQTFYTDNLNDFLGS